jgi:hypothetical protein
MDKKYLDTDALLEVKSQMAHLVLVEDGGLYGSKDHTLREIPTSRK